MNPNDIPDPETLQENTDSFFNSLVAGPVDDENAVKKKSNGQTVMDNTDTNSLVAGTVEHENAVEKKWSEQGDNLVMISNKDLNADGEKLHATSSYIHSPDLAENEKIILSMKDGDNFFTQKSNTDAPVVNSDSAELKDSVIHKSGENNAALEHDDDRVFPTDDGNKQGFDSEKKSNISENTAEFKSPSDCINDVTSNGHINGKALSRSGDLATMEVQAKPILPTTEKDPSDLDQQPRVYKRRWMIVFLFAFYSLSNAYQWIHLNIIGDVILKYYNASMPEDQFQRETTLDWLSMVYMLAYIPLIFPATWLLNKKGLRVVAICGCFLNALGAWLKVACVSPDRFPVLMFAQTICAIAQIFILGLPARLAAVWFGPNEVSTATSIGVFGNQVGCAVGFLLPPVLVPYSEDLNQIGKDMGTMFYMGAGVTTFFFIMVILIFKNAPPMPPSKAQMLSVQNASNEHYGQSLLRLVKNRGFILLTLTYGINTGSYYAISTLLNPIVLYYFEGHQKDAGQIGLTIVLAGVVGSIVAGVWLDRTKTFKGTTVGIYFLSMAGMIAFTFTLKLDILWVVYLCAGALGFFMTGYLPVGFEFAAEITYPESEGTSSGLLNASAQTFGIILTIGMRAMLNNISILSANITICVALLIGTVITAFIGANYKRQEAGREMMAKIDQLEYIVDEKSQMADQSI